MRLPNDFVSVFKRLAIYRRDGLKCFVCGESDIFKLSLDHIKPRSKGENHNPNNLITMCMCCNSHKQSQSMGEFVNSKGLHWKTKRRELNRLLKTPLDVGQAFKDINSAGSWRGWKNANNVRG